MNLILERAGIEISENFLRMRDFVEEVDDGGVPSRDLLKHFADAFRHYLKRHNRDDLIDRLCPPGPEHGQLTYFNKFRKLDKESAAMVAYYLRLCDGETTRTAAKKVAGIGSPDTVRRMYRKNLLGVEGLTWQSILSEVVGPDKLF